MAEATPVASGSKPKSSHFAVSEEGGHRADTYAVLASLLSQSPSDDLLDYLRHIETPADALKEVGAVGQAWQQLAQAADAVDTTVLNDEYHALFIGLGRGEVIPYGSWHISGFMMDKPLSDLREDLALLGIEPDPEQKDPEDHIAALFETMALLIRAPDIDESRERMFFIRHIHPWAEKFFRDLQDAGSARFYRSVALLGQQFMQLENQYLNAQAH